MWSLILTADHRPDLADLILGTTMSGKCLPTSKNLYELVTADSQYKEKQEILLLQMIFFLYNGMTSEVFQYTTYYLIQSKVEDKFQSFILGLIKTEPVLDYLSTFTFDVYFLKYRTKTSLKSKSRKFLFEKGSCIFLILL